MSVGKYPITQIDLFKIKLIAILSGNKIVNSDRLQIRDLANSLIKKTLKL